ncbi:yjeF N-terminal domain-containing 3-like isoform X1 [Tachysurus fulvidraco]|uniref:yjeF N-terminal domain-containing 3-like isoform X1 n=2 Tax=Tachysurus fulvidraco TaxID=1234273 RepID=UPI001FEF0574|nr:yjeF N-terminal domain-containing 3-like isoform X1 [Tachysurus fulvidraco]
MNHSGADQDCESTQMLHYLSKEEAVAMGTELLRDYHFGLHQLTEILGHACAVAITKTYPLSTLGKRQPTVLVVCGPDQNGCVGLACARYLRLFEYMPTVFYPKRSSQSPHLDFTVQCEKMDIPFLSYLPTEVQLINDAYNLVVDALLGPETELGAAKEPFSSIMLTLRGIKIPIASLDIPSGWDPDEASVDGINPNLLISLIAPKRCALSFSGTHLLAGRLLPYDIQKKYELNLPKFPSTACITELQ